jgi:hypothetical protein
MVQFCVRGVGLLAGLADGAARVADPAGVLRRISSRS